LISDIKSKIPTKKKQNEDSDGGELSESVEVTDADFKADKTNLTQVGDIDVDEDYEVDSGGGMSEEEPKSLVDKVKANFANKGSGKKSDKKNKSLLSPPIAIAIGIGLIFFILGDEIFPPDGRVVPAQTNTKKEPKKTESAPTDTAPAEATPAETASTDVTPSDTVITDPTPTDSTSVETAPIEAPKDTTTTSTATETGATVTPPVETTPAETETSVTPPIETAPSETTVVETAPAETKPAVTTPADNTSVDSVDGEIPVTTDDSMTDKILQDLENQVKESTPKEQITTYVSPPDYEFRGRGLVYNCVGKHWACVDAPSYKTCEDNSSSTKFLKKSLECYPFNVYQTQTGCEKMQNRMVSSSAKTKFCSEN
jgi:hypothetical protein